MKNRLRFSQGSPLPQGATHTQHGVNFSIFSRNAHSVTLVLELPQSAFFSPHLEHHLDPRLNKTGDIWHIQIDGLPEDFRYGYRMHGSYAPRSSGHAYEGRLVLLDPYATRIASTPWGKDKRFLGSLPACMAPSAVYDWEGDRPLNIPLKDSIIYELHVRGFSNHPSSQVAHPGTFRGIIEKIPYLQHLGITAVELMPVTEFNENESLFTNPLTGERLKNYWGYSPLSFFAPKAAYADPDVGPLDEFRDMVKALHRAGIEVIVDMVFNHTAEGGADGPTTSFRGIDNTIYYLLDPSSRDYLNFSGCGNTCNCNHPIVRNLIMDALRWWVVELHVDGFRFDLASILGRDPKGHVLANPPVVESIAEDPVLANAKIIAEAWDAAGLYQVGSFSTHHRWAEWNGRFRDDIRAFMRGDRGLIPALATRIAGSSDLYQVGDRRPCNSINFVTSHDGFTLSDLVSYDHKHNRNNGEDNRDGDNHNLSWNSGQEGPTKNPLIQTLRSRRIRSMLTILLLSQGVPMLVAGDEFGRSQKGNNNAWCQDNAISWLNWQHGVQEEQRLRFVRYLIQLRRNHPVFRRDRFFLAEVEGREPVHLREISWQGLQPGSQDWSDDCHTLAFLLNGAVLPEIDADDFFIMLNGHRDHGQTFIVPPLPTRHRSRTWRRIIDTAQRPPHDALELEAAPEVRPGNAIRVQSLAVVVLQSIPMQRSLRSRAKRS